MAGDDETHPIRILLIEETLGDSALIEQQLVGGRHGAVSLSTRSTIGDGLDALAGQKFDVVLLHLGLTDAAGEEAFDRFRRAAPDTPTMVVSGPVDDAVASRCNAVASRCNALGAQDFYIKSEPESLIAGTVYNTAARLAKERELSETLADLEQLVSDDVDATLILDEDHTIKFANEAATALFGGRAAAGQAFWLPEGRELDVSGSEGRVATVEMRLRRSRWRGEPVRIVTFRDVSRYTARTKEHLHGVARAIRNMGRLIVREKDPERLLRTGCDMLVETRGYTASWIIAGDLDDPPAIIVGSGWGGAAENPLELLRREGQWPRCRTVALATGDGVAVMGGDEKCAGCPLADIHKQHLAAVAVLRYGDTAYGLLGVSFPTEITIDDEERSLLAEVAEDIALGLYNIERERRGDETESRFRTYVDYAPAGIFIADRNGRYIDVNAAACVMTGYTREELLAMSIYDLAPPDAPPEAFAAFSRLEETGSINDEVLIRRSDGTDIYVVLKATALGGDRFMAFCSDITERKEAEAALRESEAALRRERDFAENLIETANAVVLVLDPEGTIVLINRYMETLSGYRLDEVRGKSWFDTFLPIGERESVRSLFEHAISESPTRGNVATILTRDGEERLIKWYDSPLRNDRKEVTGLLAIGQDVTESRAAAAERADLESQLLQSQKMESIGRLAGGVAHDFNNLLTVIANFADFAMEDLKEGDPLRSDIQQIIGAADRATSLTRQLLALSRRQVMEPKVLDLNGIITELEKMLRRLIGEDIELVTILDEDLGLVNVDPGQMEQVIMNLAVNARDAMPRGGRLMVETADVVVDEALSRRHPETPPGTYVRLRVRDDGIGMAEAVRTRIFEPFFTTKENGRGTGLGLATVYGIVKQSSGDIWVRSAPGEGTTFEIYLPRAAANTPEERSPGAEAGPLRGSESILVVEDDRLVRQVAERALKSAGYRVIVAANGGEALLDCERFAGRIDLVLTDVVMPKMSGHELVERLGAAYPGLRVLFMSGYTDDDLLRRSIQEDRASFLSKPFNAQNLLQKVRQVLSERTSVAPPPQIEG